MKGTAAVNSVALCRGFNSREEMIELTKIDPDTIDDDDQRTWPEQKIIGTITINRLSNGGFKITEGDRYNEDLGFDEALGMIAALIVPKEPGNLKWMKTKEEHNAWEDHLAKLREQRKTQS